MKIPLEWQWVRIVLLAKLEKETTTNVRKTPKGLTAYRLFVAFVCEQTTLPLLPAICIHSGNAFYVSSLSLPLSMLNPVAGFLFWEEYWRDIFCFAQRDSLRFKKVFLCKKRWMLGAMESSGAAKSSWLLMQWKCVIILLPLGLRRPFARSSTIWRGLAGQSWATTSTFSIFTQTSLLSLTLLFPKKETANAKAQNMSTLSSLIDIKCVWLLTKESAYQDVYSTLCNGISLL